MWEKLTWDIQQFDQIQRSNPDIPEPLGFAAINVCISAASLRDWTLAAVMRRRRAEKMPVNKQAVLDHIYENVPQQKMCEAIANTAKHAALSTSRWPNGAVQLTYEDDSESDPPSYVLRHIHSDGISESIALNAFGTLQRCWWSELKNLDFDIGTNPLGFEWRQRQLREIFGDHHEYVRVVS